MSLDQIDRMNFRGVTDAQGMHTPPIDSLSQSVLIDFNQRSGDAQAKH
ncbi:hypothetical protein [Mameliella sp. MMSF_3510]|nr:hypothetical protein [Mameliella sp. MMSF_3510]